MSTPRRPALHILTFATGEEEKVKSKDDKNTLTLEQIRRQEATLAALERQAEELQVEEETLGREIVKALAAGAKQDAKPLRARRREVRETRADILEALPLLRERITTQRKQVGNAEAERRLTGIGRAYGSLVTEYAEDGKRLVEAAQSYAAAKESFNARFVRLKRLVAEQGALIDRFELAATTLPTITIPALHEKAAEAYELIEGTAAFLDHAPRTLLSPATEKCEHGLRQRRTYEEIKGSPTFEIIESAGGAKDWPALTERQKEIVADRKAEAEAEKQFVQRAVPEIEAAQVMPGSGNVLRR